MHYRVYISSVIFTVSIRLFTPVNQKLHVEKFGNHGVTPLMKLPRLTLHHINNIISSKRTRFPTILEYTYAMMKRFYCS